MFATVAEETKDTDGALAAWTLHWRLRTYPYLQDSKAGGGLDKLQAAVTGTGSLKELGAVAAGDTVASKAALDWLAGLTKGKGEVAHAAGLALGRALDARAVQPLIAALGCTGPGACGAKALEGLRRLTGRGYTTAAEWQGWAKDRLKKEREDWVLESLEQAGFKANWGEPASSVQVQASSAAL